MLASLNETRLTASIWRPSEPIRGKWLSGGISIPSTDCRRRRLALAALEKHYAVPKRRVPGPWRLDVQEHAVLEGAVFDEIEVGLAHLRPIGVVDQNQAARPEKRLGEVQPVELIFVRMRSVEQVQPQCLFVLRREILAKISFAEHVLRTAGSIESPHKGLPR